MMDPPNDETPQDGPDPAPAGADAPDLRAKEIEHRRDRGARGPAEGQAVVVAAEGLRLASPATCGWAVREMLGGLVLSLAVFSGCQPRHKPVQDVVESKASPVPTRPAPASRSDGPWTLMFVALPDSPFSVDVGDAAPWLLWDTIELKPQPGDRYRIGSIRVDERVDVQFADLVAAEPSVEPPPSTVWLVGPDGVCEADVQATTARLDLYEGGETEAAVLFALSGCAGMAWAPLAIVTGTPTPELRWFPAKALPLDRAPAGALGREYRKRAVDQGGTSPHVEIVGPAAPRPGAPTIVEVRYGSIDPQAHCTQWLRNALGLVDGNRFDPWSCKLQDGDDCSMYQLLGSVGTPQQPHFAVLVDHTFSPAIHLTRGQVLYLPATDDDFASLPYIAAPTEDWRERSFTDLDPCELDEEEP